MIKSFSFFLMSWSFVFFPAFCVDFPAVRQSKNEIMNEQSATVVSFPEPGKGAAENEKLLQAVTFPQTFEDLSFKSRMDFLTESYAPYEIVYENGVCVSGCAYPGITLAEDMAAVDEATEEMADLIEEAEQDPKDENPPATDWCHNGLSSTLPLRYPVDMTNLKYKISSDFGYRPASENGARFHPAIDIACPTGTPVYATADGVVLWAHYDKSKGGAGYNIGIQHDNNLITQYLHLSKMLVRPNQKVRACDKIALSGVSGVNVDGVPYSGPHLDYRIRFGDKQSNKFVDILCPCKISTDVGRGESSDSEMSCKHSLFHAPYKFSNYNPNNDVTKRSKWRVEHKHCMTKSTDLLPDETRESSQR